VTSWISHHERARAIESAHPPRGHDPRGCRMTTVIRPYTPMAPTDGLEAWAQMIERGYEGLVAKGEASTYEGGRTMQWLKVKQKDWTVEEDGWRRRISAASSPKTK